jgi:hypothetical protein
MLENHSSVSIIDCIADFLMNNRNAIEDIDGWDNCVSEIYVQSKERIVFDNEHARSLIAKLRRRKEDHPVNVDYPIVPIFLFFWSDDFDPNRGIKSNRQSIWIKTCTLKCLGADGIEIESTYPISVSKKEMDHEEIEKLVYRELKFLSTGKFIIMYSRSHGGPVFVHADVYCYKMDQPERRSNLKLLAGNSNIHGRYGYLLDIKKK